MSFDPNYYGRDVEDDDERDEAEVLANLAQEKADRDRDKLRADEA